MISPLIMWIVSEKSGEFQEKLFKSQFEAKYRSIFLTYLVSIRYVIALFYTLGYWWDYKCSTTSKWDTRKINKFTTSARDLINLFIFIIILFSTYNKKGAGKRIQYFYRPDYIHKSYIFIFNTINSFRFKPATMNNLYKTF